MHRSKIEVDNFSKLYRLGAIGSTTLRASVERLWHRWRKQPDLLHRIGGEHPMISPEDPQAGPEPNTLWALRHVSFKVDEGEIVGVIGRNGSGKSTLLKILSKITEPTEGRAVLRGKVSSLLEVGTGFHGELSGRENIYLNGSFIGMRRREIDQKFDAIVSFAELEKFIDTPVKRYSSGMYIRLAFAVAAHLEPDILMVDEVLAVGDQAFQAKCLNKTKEVASRGRTVLFVSHDLSSIARLCHRCVWLEKGRIAAVGPTTQVIEAYLKRSYDPVSPLH